MRKYLFQALVIMSAATVAVSCKKDDNDDQNTTYTVSGNGSGLQEVPAVTTTGSSSVTGTYRVGGRLLNYSVTWTSLSASPTMMHFHGPADPGANAGVMMPITGFPATAGGTYSGVDTLTVDEEAALLGGKMYYNVHTVANPNGEVRAQLGVKKN